MVLPKHHQYSASQLARSPCMLILMLKGKRSVVCVQINLSADKSYYCTSPIYWYSLNEWQKGLHCEALNINLFQNDENLSGMIQTTDCKEWGISYKSHKSHHKSQSQYLHKEKEDYDSVSVSSYNSFSVLLTTNCNLKWR